MVVQHVFVLSIRSNVNALASICEPFFLIKCRSLNKNHHAYEVISSDRILSGPNRDLSVLF